MKALLLGGWLAAAMLLSVPMVAAAGPAEAAGALQAAPSRDPADFYQSAASANRFQIEAAELAIERAGDAKVKTYAEMMLEDHRKADRKLTKLAVSKGVELPTQLLKHHQVMLDGLKEEEQAAAFDDDYRRKMVMAHEEVVALFGQSAKMSPDPDVRAFAESLLPKLQMHGNEAEKLKAATR